jgi:hypothetical protein
MKKAGTSVCSVEKGERNQLIQKEMQRNPLLGPKTLDKQLG